MTLPFVVLLPIAGAGLPALFVRVRRDLSPWIAAGVTASALALLLYHAPPIFVGETLTFLLPWIPELGLDLSFRLDGLGFLFALLVLGLGLLVIVYTRYYFYKSHPGRFYAFLLLFMGAMLGIVLSGNLLMMVVFWELTSLSSFLLIGYWKHKPEARQGARMALVVTGGGGLAMMAGFLLLGNIAGSFELVDILTSGQLVRSHQLYGITTVLILFGAFTKSAQFPFHFWLPNAMTAPTPASAYLHSATMVKAGVFLLARLHPVLSGTDMWFYLVSGAGLASLVIGAYMALFKHDLKALLAYSTISHLGLITLLFGLGTPLAPVAGIFHIINHAIFKASLFMAAGIIDQRAGTRDMRLLSGLWRYMPYTGALAMVSAAAMAGVPLLNGFLSKEMFYSEIIERTVVDERSWLVPTIATLTGAFSVAYSIRFIHDVFFGGNGERLPRKPAQLPRWIKIPVEILVGLCLLVGLFPSAVVGPILLSAARSALGGEMFPYDLHIWHGFNIPVLMSAIALLAGTLVYLRRRWLFALHDRVFPLFTSREFYNTVVNDLFTFSRWMTRSLHNGSLQRYMALLVTSTVLVSGFAFPPGTSVRGSEPFMAIDIKSVLLLAGVAATSVGTVLVHRRRLTAVVFLSAVGLLVSLTFVRFSAPDLALTQLAVELVTIILLLLALYYLPQETPKERSLFRKCRDVILSGALGLCGAGLAWAVLTRPVSGISHFYLEKSLPEGGGANVVNVILVDFRAFDTLGEITVLAIAAPAIYAMIEGLRLNTPTLQPENGSWARDRYPLVLTVISRVLLPLALLVSVYLFLRGHNQPGGGFVAGLVTSVALIMQYLASGTRWTQKRLGLDYHPLIAAGVLLAFATGLIPWIFGLPFLTGAFRHFHLPVIGEFELASALAFDLGVFFAVVGTVMLILANLGRLSGPNAGDSKLTGEEKT